MAGDGLVAELLAQQGILQRRIVAGHGGAERAPTDAVASLIETHEGRLKPPEPGSSADAGTRTSCMERPEVTEARRDHLPWTS